MIITSKCDTHIQVYVEDEDGWSRQQKKKPTGEKYLTVVNMLQKKYLIVSREMEEIVQKIKKKYSRVSHSKVTTIAKYIYRQKMKDNEEKMQTTCLFGIHVENFNKIGQGLIDIIMGYFGV